MMQKVQSEMVYRYNENIYYLLTESEVITGKYQTEALMYWPSDRGQYTQK